MAYRYEQLGEYSNAQRFYSVVYRSCAATLGPSHPDTIQSQKDLAALDSICRDMQDYNQTVEIFGENHRETAIKMLRIAKIYMNSGNFKTAKECYSWVMRILDPTFNIDYQHIATAAYNLGIIYEKLGDINRARQFCIYGLRIRSRYLGPEHEETGKSYTSLGVICWCMDMGTITHILSMLAENGTNCYSQ
ncbi:hypothetical protein BC938DRAFT_473709 [Jimgerdemannia flammicorona]|uniref:Tetratricopeptide repeat-domain-containing protein n=1 Tax=Jimgerdemannia flammicorona TaxID=994334 RepID=A0A433QT27_9FUNG|nr:hypothetical protein BC938DRAFT_473709 [Jimgerdemannia flammicorona]